MTGTYHDPAWTEKVTIPVKRVGDQWEFFYGGPVPVKDGAVGELVLSAGQVTDKAFLKQMQQQALVKVLPEGTELWVALSDQTESKISVAQNELIDRSDLPAGTTRFESVFLGPAKKNVTSGSLFEDPGNGGLWLKVKGLDKTDLLSSTIRLPAELKKSPAISLNHALTILSEQYETHRLSHTGNVYTRIFYQEGNGRWYPLADLREGVLANVERTLIADSWKQLEALIGWRPVIRPRKK
jgi:hypothetical protein